MAAILVIDDSVAILEWMQEVLSKAGHHVVLASNGRHGIVSLRKMPIDLVITDIYMPEKDGVEIIQYARRAAPQVKLVAMSSRPPEHNLFKTAMALGAVGTLQKPFSEEQLLKAVASPRIGKGPISGAEPASDGVTLPSQRGCA